MGGMSVPILANLAGILVVILILLVFVRDTAHVPTPDL